MLITCEKCGVSEAKLDLDANKVICTKCKEEVAVTSFAKQMMKDRRDILEKSDIMLPPDGMLTTCENAQCQKAFSAEVDRDADTVTCPYCKKPANISVIAKNMLRSNGIFVGATNAYFEQEGKEAVSPKEYARQQNKGVVEANNAKIEVSTEEVGKIVDIFSSEPLPETIQRVMDVSKEVTEKSLNSAPAFKRAS